LSAEAAAPLTTGHWQRLEPAAAWAGRMAPPYQHGVPVQVDANHVLLLPVRPLPHRPGHAVASLIANQASLPVARALGLAMGQRALPMGAEVLVGLPTLGMVFAPTVAEVLEHSRWVPMGYSHKFWYDEALSTVVSSITTPPPGKRIFLDPNQRPLITGRRVLLVDDVISSGTTLNQVWTLLETLGAEVVGGVVAMRQGSHWRQALGPERSARVAGVFDTPLLQHAPGGWWPQDPAPGP
jgi:adenine/guanine phosphoribosyltransferase-like PRPP-binding protein